MPFEFIFFALVLFLSGIISEMTGFGVATVSMSLLPFVFPLPVIIPLVAVLSTVSTGIIAFKTKTEGIGKYVILLLAGSVTGVTIGMVFLKSADDALLKNSLGVFLIAYAFYGLFFKKHLFPKGKISAVATGLAAGIFGASFNIQGPLIGMYSSSKKDLSKMEVRDLMATYIFFTGLMTVIGHIASGRMTQEVLFHVIFALPFLFMGLIVGEKYFKIIKEIWIKRIIYVAVMSAGIALII